MSEKTYASYLELAALPAVGAVLLSPRPAWVFSADGRAILWANAAGARAFGAASIGDLLARRRGDDNPLARQLTRLARTLPSAAPRIEILKFSNGFSMTTMPAACQRISCADGGRAVLAVAAGGNYPAESVTSRAEALVVALGGGPVAVVAKSAGFPEISTVSEGLADGGGERRVVRTVRFDADGETLALAVVGDDDTALTDEDVGKTDEGRAEAAAAPEAAPAEPENGSDVKALRFRWRIDETQRFTAVSDELARAVGDEHGDIVGKSWRDVVDSWRDVSKTAAPDDDTRVQRALDSCVAWRGVTVTWPTADGTGVAVTLSAEPVDIIGVFRGFRGVGIVQMSASPAAAAAAVESPQASDAVHPVGAAGRIEQAKAAVAQAWEDERIAAESWERADAADTPAADAPPDALDEVARITVEQGAAEGEGAALDATAADFDLEAAEAAAVDANAAPPPDWVEAGAEAAELPEPDRQAGATNVVRLPNAAIKPPPGQERLSGNERDAFRRIAESLGREPDGSEGGERVYPSPGSPPRSVGGEDPPSPTRGEGPPEHAAAPSDESKLRTNGEVALDPAEPKSGTPDFAAGEGDTPHPAPTARPSPTNADRAAFDSSMAKSATPDFAAREGESVASAAADVVAPAETVGPSDHAALLDRLPIAVVVFREAETLYANAALVDLLDYDDAEDFFAAGGREALFADDEPAWARGENGRTGGALTARMKDGTMFPVDARLQSLAWGEAPALMLSLREPAKEEEADTVPRTLIEEIAAVQDRLSELEAILDVATDGVIVLDAEGRIGNLNRSAEALFGIEAGDVLGRPFTELLAEESHRGALDYLDGLASNGVASVLNDGREVIGKVPAGGLIPLFMTMGRLGRTGKFCAVLRDITHWKTVEEELVAARRAAETASSQKSEFLAKISHEIRTPLNAIIGFSEVMMEERFGPIGTPRYKDYLRDIHVSGAHLMSLINDLLDLSKIEAGKLELTFEAVAVNGVIQESVALMQPQANRARIIIRTSLADGMPKIVADVRALRQILLNLLSNAIKFTPEGGQVIVSTAIEGSGEVTIRVRDTGVGMNPDDIETALMPFRQLATSGRGRTEGTGLGLPLTKALVEANRATFSIESQVNHGTLVKVTFPNTRVLAG